MNIFVYSFEVKFSRMSHSGTDTPADELLKAHNGLTVFTHRVRVNGCNIDFVSSTPSQ